MAYALGGVRPHVRAAVEEIAPMFGITTVYGVGLRSNTSYHPSGRAADFMTTDRDKLESLAAYARANAARLGVIEVIVLRKIWTTKRADEGWRAMEDRGNPTANHEDHVHLSFSAGPGTGGEPIKAREDNSSGGPFGAIKDIVTALNDGVRWITDPKNWLRIAAFAIGAVMLLVAFFTTDTVARAGRSVKNTIEGVI